HAEVVDEDVRDPVRRLEQPAVAPCAGRVTKRDAIAVAGGDPAVEQLRRAVETIRVRELRHTRPVHPRPEVRRRQALPDEPIDVRGTAWIVTHGTPGRR